MGKAFSNITTIAKTDKSRLIIGEASKEDKILIEKNTIAKGDVRVQQEPNLISDNIKKGVSLWGIDGSLDTASNSGENGSVYLNYNNMVANNINTINETISDTVTYIGIRPNFCGKTLKLYSSIDGDSYTIGAYGDFVYVIYKKNLQKYNTQTCAIVWEADLSSYLTDNLLSTDKFFATQDTIWLLSANGGREAVNAKIITIKQSDGTIVNARNVGSVVTAKTLAIQVSMQTTSCDVYLFVASSGMAYFEKATYQKTGVYTSSVNSGAINMLQSDASGIFSVSFSTDYNCIAMSMDASQSCEYFIFGNSASLVMHKNEKIKLEYSDGTTQLLFIRLNNYYEPSKDGKITVLYNYRNDHNVAYAILQLGSTGVLTTEDVHRDMGLLEGFLPSSTCFVKEIVTNEYKYYYYATSNRFFIIFYIHSDGRLYIALTERIGSENVGGARTPFVPILNPMNNLVYYNDVNADYLTVFRDNSYSNVTISATLDD